jgi:spore coat protein H
MRATVRVALAAIFALAAAAGAGAQTADDLFDASTLRDLRLFVHSTDWAELKATFQENTFYPADLTWGNTTVRNVALRSRGFGSRSPAKPGLLLRFNRYDSAQRFLGLTSLVLDNLTQDPSTMKEVLSMQLYRRLGVPAPREAFVRLFVNNTFLGLYAVVEDIAAPFLQRTLGESTGTLYEYGWTFEYRFDYRGSGLDAYRIFKPQLNAERSTFDLYSPIEAMVRAANESSDEAFADAMSPYVDLQALARYLAAENFVSDDDGWLGNWGMNNFYLYKRPNARFEFIAWDKDYTFWRPDNDIFLRVDDNVLARRALAVPDVRQAYLDGLTTMADAASEGQEGNDASTGWMAREIERLYGLVQAAVAADTNKPNTMEQFEAAVADLRTFALRRSAFVRCSVANQSRRPIVCN